MGDSNTAAINMNKQNLKEKLDELNINPNFYSLYGELLPDRTVLHDNYNDWEVFYFSERGERQDEKTFFNENDACQFIYDKFKNKVL